MDCIYIPLIENEIDDLHFVALAWRVFPPFTKSYGRNVDLVISFDRLFDHFDAEKIERFFSEFGFSKIIIISANLSKEEAVYIREPSDFTGELPLLGCKSGPNLHWVFNQEYLNNKYQWSMQYEVDVIPAQRLWFEIIRSGLRENWLISGAIYRGPTRLGAKVINHINGNSLYNTKHEHHKKWIELTRRSIMKNIGEGDLGPAFDVAPFTMLTRFFSEESFWLFKELEGVLDNEDELRDIISALSYNEKIWNFTGGVEFRENYLVDFMEERRKYCEGVAVIHSSMYRLWILGEILDNHVMLSTHEKKFISSYFSSNLFPKKHRNAIYRRLIEPNKKLENSLKSSPVVGSIWRHSLCC